MKHKSKCLAANRELSLYKRFAVKFLFKGGVEESIVNNAKSEVRFKQVIRNPWCVHNRFFNTNFEEKFK
jgi:hypothetical protein